jgi:hypothetical protein
LVFNKTLKQLFTRVDISAFILSESFKFYVNKGIRKQGGDANNDKIKDDVMGRACSMLSLHSVIVDGFWIGNRIY